jgi:hypothetical protein
VASRSQRYNQFARNLRAIAEDVRGNSDRKMLIEAAREFEALAGGVKVGAKTKR